MHPEIEIVTCSQGVPYLTCAKCEAKPSSYDNPEGMTYLPNIVVGVTKSIYRLSLYTQEQ